MKIVCNTRKKELMTYPAHRTTQFQNAIFYSSSKIINTINNKYIISFIIEKDIKCIIKLLQEDPLYNFEECFKIKVYR